MNSHSTEPVTQSNHSRMRRHRRSIESLERHAKDNRTSSEKAADYFVDLFGNMRTVWVHVIVFTFWILANTGALPGVPEFDPFPYSFLTMIVSLEAIFLSLFVLMSQNRESQIDDLRQEVDLNVDLIAEEEITKILHLLARMYEHLKIPMDDPELKRMMKPTDIEEIEAQLREQLNIKLKL